MTEALTRAQVEELVASGIDMGSFSIQILGHDAALRAERDEYRRKYELLKNDPDYNQCCDIRMAIEAERDDWKLQYELLSDDYRQMKISNEHIRAERDALKNEVCTAEDQIPPDMDGDSLSVALIKLKDERDALKAQVGWLLEGSHRVSETCACQPCTDTKSLARELTAAHQKVADLTLKLAETTQHWKEESHLAVERFHRIKKLESTLAESEKSYHDLIMEVGHKHPNESRHDTAKRYIRRAEQSEATPCGSALKEPS